MNYLIVFLILALISGLRKKQTVLSCGLIGYCGNTPFDVDKLKLLFAMNEVRGKDSCGYYTHSEKLSFWNRTKKEVGEVTKKMLPTFDPEPSNIFIGHTRASTVGATTIHNAHPFISGDYVLAHNGTLTNLNLLKKKYQNLKGFFGNSINVDSKVFPEYLSATDGNLDVLSDYEGAAALMWCKKNEDQLNVFHNKMVPNRPSTFRPLHYGFIENEETGEVGIYISSEKYPLVTIGCKNIEEFDTNEVFTLKDGEVLKETVKIKRAPISLKSDNADDIISDKLAKSLCKYMNDNIHKVFYTIENDVRSITHKDNKITTCYSNHLIDIHYKDSFLDRKTKDYVISIDNLHKGEFILTKTYDDKSYQERYVQNANELLEMMLDEQDRKKDTGAKKNEENAPEKNKIGNPNNDDQDDDDYIPDEIQGFLDIHNNATTLLNQMVIDGSIDIQDEDHPLKEIIEVCSSNMHAYGVEISEN